MRFRAVLSGSLILSLHFSLCTGGIMTVALAFASNFSPITQLENVVMSPATPDLFSCLMQSPNVDQHGVATETNGCTESSHCLTQTFRDSTDRLAFIDPPQITEPIALYSFISFIEIKTPLLSILPRAGPLFGEAKVYARSLVKRE